MENKIGQVTWTTFKSEAEFDEFYAGKMKDGSNDLIKDVYPLIHYKGSDDIECARITKEKATHNYSHPLMPFIHAIAEIGEMEAAEKLYAEVKTHNIKEQ